MPVNVQDLYKYANAQMAAEAFLNNGMEVSDLVQGNLHASRFTEVQAKQFLDDGWTLKAHLPNTTALTTVPAQEILCFAERVSNLACGNRRLS